MGSDYCRAKYASKRCSFCRKGVTELGRMGSDYCRTKYALKKG